MSKYLAVDIGNVLLSMNFDSFLEKLSSAVNISKKDAWSFLERTQKSHDVGFALIRTELRDYFKIGSDEVIDEIMNEWYKTLTPHQITIPWLEEMIDSGINVALLSNMGSEHRSIMKELLGEKIYNNAIRFFSVDVGARKPTFIFYEIFLSMHPEYRGCCYLDDNLENLKVGAEFGFLPVPFDISTLNDKEIEDKLSEVKSELFFYG